MVLECGGVKVGDICGGIGSGSSISVALGPSIQNKGEIGDTNQEVLARTQ